MKFVKIALVLFLLFATLNFFSSGCEKKIVPQIKNMAEGKKVLLVITPVDYQDKEYSDTRNALRGQAFRFQSHRSKGERRKGNWAEKSTLI